MRVWQCVPNASREPCVVQFSPYGPHNQTALLVEQVLSKQVFSLIFFKKIACHYHTRMGNKSSHSESEFYLYPEEQDNSTCDITFFNFSLSGPRSQ